MLYPLIVKSDWARYMTGWNPYPVTTSRLSR